MMEEKSKQDLRCLQSPSAVDCCTGQREQFTCLGYEAALVAFMQAALAAANAISL